MNKRVILASALFFIFAFWLILTKNNYFHWDEWSFILGFNQPPLDFLTKSYGEHYIPLNILNHYLFFSVFGLNNFPFQLSVLFFHLLNCLLLFKILCRTTKNFKFNLLAVLIFGISNVYVEDVIWSQGISNVASATFVFLAYYLSILTPFKRKYILLATLSLLISPLFNDLGVLMPLAFIFKEIVQSKKIRSINKFNLAAFSVALLINLLVIFHFSNSAINGSVKFGFDSILKIPQFVMFGILRGTIIRFIYPGFHFVSGFQQSKTIFVSFLSFLAIGGGLIALYQWLSESKTRAVRIKQLLILSVFIITGYFTVALGRTSFGLAQAGISRYAYQPFFFLLIAIVSIAKSFPRKSKLFLLVGVFLFVINMFAVARFQKEFWGIMVNRDRTFIQETDYLLENNFILCDASIPGIFPHMKLSNMWFLHHQNYFISENCEKVIDQTKMDAKSIQIINRINGEYQKKFD